MVDLPSKGLLYPENHPLASGQVEMKYMTAREEDILTNQNYIKQGIVVDKLLQSMIVTKFDYSDLLVGDKDAIMLAARVLGYGKDYTFNHYSANLEGTNELTIDLTLLKEKILDESLITRGKNEFHFKLPHTGNEITFKMLTHGDELAINKDIEATEKVLKQGNEITARYRRIIVEVGGNRDLGFISNFVSNQLLAGDSRGLRKYMKSITPDLDLTFNYEHSDGEMEALRIPFGLNFFYPAE
jgi:hypothetical protein